MVKRFKEYLGVSTIRVSGLDAIQPMSSLSRKGTDIAPKGKGGWDRRAVGLVAGTGDSVSTSAEPTTMDPTISMVNAKVQDKKKKWDSWCGQSILLKTIFYIIDIFIR